MKLKHWIPFIGAIIYIWEIQTGRLEESPLMDIVLGYQFLVTIFGLAYILWLIS